MIGHVYVVSVVLLFEVYMINQDVSVNVWGVFVGEGGNQLAAFNSNDGPFPPKPGAHGYIAIGWAAVGDMKMYKGNYPDFLGKFSIVYKYDNERVLSTQAGRVWAFAYEIKAGDYVISPSSDSGYLLVGNILGDYESDFDNWESVAKAKTRADLMHLRRVKWMIAIKSGDKRYEKLHRIGQLAVGLQKLTENELIEILNS